MDDTTLEALISGMYDLVIALVPTRRLIDERRYIQHPPDNFRVVNLTPRPWETCGVRRNEKWSELEKNNMSALGKDVICKGCPKIQGECHWPFQYGRNLRGTNLIYATQAHLRRSPNFIQLLITWTGAQKTLLILDEANFFMRSFKMFLDNRDLRRFVDVIRQTRFGGNDRLSRLNETWEQYLDLLLYARTEDLISPDWQAPLLDPAWILAIQNTGHRVYSDGFKFIGYDTQQFQFSIPESREKVPGSGIRYSVRPVLPCDTIVYSASVNAELTKYRLNMGIYSPFENIRFMNEGTRWYNIDSRMGMLTYFDRNMPAILAFFALLIAKRIEQGKKIMLISKKDLLDRCATELQNLMAAFGCNAIVRTDFSTEDLDQDTRTIPLIHYGVIGVNDFQDFDCAYCLNGYYVNESVVNTVLQDIISQDLVLPLKIQTTRSLPRRRLAGAANTQDQFFDVHHMAQPVLEYLEMETVVQAVGRVRPFTSPREVITFQCHGNPCTPYTREFHNLEQARAFFDIPTAREHAGMVLNSQIASLKLAGLTQKQTVEQLPVSLSTVKRYWNKG
jgi:hypothetical protein